MTGPLLSAAIAIGVVTGCLAGTSDASPHRLADPDAGWSLSVPEGWRTGPAVVATAFARGARCRSAFVVDRNDSGGPGPALVRSFVQVCARAIRDASGLAGFLTATYGAGFRAQFAAAAVAGRPAYRSRRGDPALVFLQTGDHRLQLASSASRDPARRRQLAAALRSLRVGDPG